MTLLITAEKLPGGDEYSQPVDHWRVYAEGDKEECFDTAPITLDLEHFR